ncbi:hypothetical protein, partial [Aeromonas veronii]|uniref:hypothetical protein n=1 Tax=Aeromonas veronii TaxID=654 RepID=UPI003D1D55C4
LSISFNTPDCLIVTIGTVCENQDTSGQPTPNGILTGIPNITDTKKPNRINQLGYIDGGGGGI